jgi:hypothetical protein
VRHKTHSYFELIRLEDIIVDKYIEVPTKPNTESGVDDPLFQSASFITLVHTARIFNPSSVPLDSLGHDIFENLGTSSN